MDLPAAVTPLTDQLGASYAIVTILEWLKKSRFAPFITYETEKLNKLLAIVLTGAAAVGINASYDYDSSTLVITGLSATSLMLAAWEWFKSYGITKFMYRAMVYKKPSAEQLEHLADEAVVAKQIGAAPAPLVFKP